MGVGVAMVVTVVVVESAAGSAVRGGRAGTGAHRALAQRIERNRRLGARGGGRRTQLGRELPHRRPRTTRGQQRAVQQLTQRGEHLQPERLCHLVRVRVRVRVRVGGYGWGLRLGVRG